MAYNFLDTSSLSHYWSSRNEIKFRLAIKFNLDFDLIREYDLNMETTTTNIIRQQLDKNDLNEFSFVEKCWLDDLLVDAMSYSYGLELNRGVLYFFERRQLQDQKRLGMREFFQIKCQLLVDPMTDRLIWIKINVKNENGLNKTKNSKSIRHLNVDRHLILQPNSFIAKLNEIFDATSPNTNNSVFRLANSNMDYIRQTFRLNELTSVLDTKKHAYNDVFTRINMSKIEIELDKQLFQLYLHLSDVNETSLFYFENQQKINAIHTSLNENLFELDANETILNLDILKMGNFKFYLLDYDEIDLTRPFSNGNKQDVFSIQNSTMLNLTHVIAHHFYSIRVKFCLNATFYKCSQTKFFLKLRSTIETIRFHSKIFTYRLISIERKYFLQKANDDRLVRLNEFEPILDLKQHLNVDKLLPNLQLNMSGSDYFILDETNGLVYVSNGMTQIETNEFEVFLVNTNTNLIQSTTRIRIEKCQISNRIHIPITSSNLTEAYLIDMNVTRENNDLELFTSYDKSYFTVNKNLIYMNISLAFDTFFKYNLFHLKEVNLELGVKLDTNFNFKLLIVLTCDQFYARQISEANKNVSFNVKIQKFKFYSLVDNLTQVDLDLSNYLKKKQSGKSSVYLLNEIKQSRTHGLDVSEYFELNERTGHLKCRQPDYLTKLNVNMSVNEFNMDELFGDALDFNVYKICTSLDTHKITDVLQLEVSFDILLTLVKKFWVFFSQFGKLAKKSL